MTPLRESFALPCLFLTVALLGGLRLGVPGVDVRLVPPPLVSLVLAVLLLGALVRSRVFTPDRLIGNHRAPIENVSGSVVLLTLFAASAQTFNLLTPDSGLLHVLVSLFFLVQLLTTLTAVRDRVGMLRSLAVLMGCAFFLRFVALESLYAPGGGVLKRVMTALMEGVTLGALDYAPTGGYRLRRIHGADVVPDWPGAPAHGQRHPTRGMFHSSVSGIDPSPTSWTETWPALRRQ